VGADTVGRLQAQVIVRWIPALLALIGGLAAAQTAPPPPRPDAGSVLQQMQPPPAQPPGVEQAAPVLKIQRAVASPSSGGGAKVQVKGFRIAGISAARADVLLPLLQRYVGPDKSLADLEDAAKDVEVALQRQGLFADRRHRHGAGA